MKLLVCFKVVSDLDQMREQDYQADSRMQVDTSFVRKMLNCFDESCLEYGLRLAEEATTHQIPMQKCALTAGDGLADPYLKTLGALGYDSVIRVDTEEKELLFHPEWTARQIAAYAEQNSADVILMGRQAPSGNHFAVPQIVAGMLRLPLIANVIELHLLDVNRMKVICEVSGNLVEQVVVTPAVFTIGNAAVSKLRTPSLKERLKYQGQMIHRDAVDLGMAEAEMAGIFPEQLRLLQQSRAGILIEAEKLELAVEAVKEQLRL